MTNVYRISVTLKEEIQGAVLQLALDKVLERFDTFRVRMRKGIFWYYFETNTKPAPTVYRENDYPCRYIEPYENNNYLFRLTYYKKRINLEVFHVLTDGNGALIFLKELTYQYLRYKYPELAEKAGNTLNADSSLDIEDSYKKNYIRPAKRSYKTEKAVILKGEKLPFNHFAILHGYIPVAEIKQAAAKYGVTINQYLLGTFTWAIYKEYLKGQPSKRPISTVVPVNLRPYFNSNTTKNFFAVVSAYFKPKKDTYTFEDVLHIIADSLKEQINKENLEKKKELWQYLKKKDLRSFIKIRYGILGQTMNIPGKSGEDFAYLPMIERDEPLTISQYTLKNMIYQTIFSIAVNDNNKLMTGELFEIKDNCLKIVSLDGHRIAIRKMPLKKDYSDRKVVVPGKTLNEISKILSGEMDDVVSIFFTNNHILFEFDQTMVVSRLIEGEYFRIDQMLSSDYETKVTVNKRELLDCIDRATLLIKEGDKKPIIINIADGSMELKIKSQIGSMDEEIIISKEGRDLLIGFNPKFLIDALRVIEDEQVDLYFMNAKAPCFIKDEQQSYIYLILPVNFNAVA